MMKIIYKIRKAIGVEGIVASLVSLVVFILVIPEIDERVVWLVPFLIATMLSASVVICYLT